KAQHPNVTSRQFEMTRSFRARSAYVAWWSSRFLKYSLWTASFNAGSFNPETRIFANGESSHNSFRHLYSDRCGPAGRRGIKPHAFAKHILVPCAQQRDQFIIARRPSLMFLAKRTLGIIDFHQTLAEEKIWIGS